MLELVPEGFIERGFVLTSLRHFIDGLELDFARFAAEFAASRQWDEEGFNSPADWMRFNCHMNANAAWNALAVGEEEAKLSQSIAAMKGGEIGFAHLATMGRTAQQLPQVFEESQLLPLAQESSPGKFHYQVQHYKHAVDAAGYNREQENLVEERSLRLSKAQDGCLLISGVLDPLGGAAVRSALEPLARPAGEHDARTQEQRHADALVELACGGRPANLQVTATIETLKGLAGAAGAEMEFSLPLSSTSVQRMACDCSVTRVLLSQESVTIDVGRSKRVISGGLSRALKARDGHCRWPGCERSASMCDGHHVEHWIDGGPTDLENLVLLCRRHHRMVHEGCWQLVKTDHQKIVTIAPTISFGMPRGPD